jgi:enolase-phosphatase E1
VLRAIVRCTSQHRELKLSPPIEAAEIRVLLLDVEGTTTPIDFVFKTLFPFASDRAEDFLRRHSQNAEVKNLVDELREDWQAQRSNGAPPWNDETVEEIIVSAAAYVRWLIARDSKFNPLKILQGKIWEEGFRSGKLQGEVYPDVAPAFARWKAQGRSIAIFSSGSVLAQRSLFLHSTAGNLSAFLDGCFDTTTGPKREAESYRKIAQSIGVPPQEVLFVSDVGEELDAASAAGMKSAHSRRPGISPLADGRHPAIGTFDQI